MGSDCQVNLHIQSEVLQGCALAQLQSISFQHDKSALVCIGLAEPCVSHGLQLGVCMFVCLSVRNSEFLIVDFVSVHLNHN